MLAGAVIGSVPRVRIDRGDRLETDRPIAYDDPLVSTSHGDPRMAFLSCLPCKFAAAGAVAVIGGAAAMNGLGLCPCSGGCDDASVATDAVAPGAVAVLEPLPAMPAGDYAVDAVHSAAMFRVQHAQAGQFWGRFNDVNGTITFTPDKDQHFSFDINVDLESVDSGNEKLDAHLKSPDFFNAKEFGKMTFKSTEVERLGQTVWDVAGDLTMNGVTKPVVAVVRFTGTGEVMGRRAGFEAEFDLKRSDFNQMYGIEKGVLGDQVRVVVAMEATKAADG